MTKINPITNNFSTPTTVLPEGERNYCIFNQNKVDFFVSQKEHSLPLIKDVLQNSTDETEIVEALYITDRLIDNGTKGVDKMYPVLAIHNYSQSPNIQTFLAGIYRKTQVPDAFGPLVMMLIKNSMKESSSIYPTAPPFDPNEEIGGAILEYISNYSKNSKPINYNA